MDPKTAFGQVLREERSRYGISQERLALAVGLDRTYVSLLERGLRQPSLLTILALATALNTSGAHLVAQVESLLSGSGGKH